jgi:hypothetical protein
MVPVRGDWRVWDGVKVAVEAAVEAGGAELDARVVVRADFVDLLRGMSSRAYSGTDARSLGRQR